MSRLDGAANPPRCGDRVTDGTRTGTVTEAGGGFARVLYDGGRFDVGGPASFWTRLEPGEPSST